MSENNTRRTFLKAASLAAATVLGSRACAFATDQTHCAGGGAIAKPRQDDSIPPKAITVANEASAMPVGIDWNMWLGPVQRRGDAEDCGSWPNLSQGNVLH